MKALRPKGMSLIEIIVVVAIFAILGILVSRIVIVTLRGSGRSDSLVRVRENLDYAISIMERQIRNAASVSPCPNSDNKRIDFTDTNGQAAYFLCSGIGTADGFVASASASTRLTANDVNIVSCSFTCSPASGNLQPAVTISLEAKDANATGIEAAKVTASTKIFLRTY